MQNPDTINCAAEIRASLLGCAKLLGSEAKLLFICCEDIIKSLSSERDMDKHEGDLQDKLISLRLEQQVLENQMLSEVSLPPLCLCI